MPKIEEQQQASLLFSKPLEASSYGVMRALVGLPFEYPLEYLKTRRQASPNTTSNFSIIYQTYQQHGVLGFYSGIGPNISLLLFKQLYRWPMMVSLPPMLQSRVFKDNGEHPILYKGLTGLLIASFESAFITPFDKYQTLLMTTDKPVTLRSLLKNHAQPIRMAMQDINIVYAHQVFGWGSFLMADEALKNHARIQYESRELSVTILLSISVIVGVINTLVSMPFETVKTLVQKDNPWPNKGVVRTMHAASQAFGVKGLYVGWQLRMTQYIFQAGLTVNLLEKLENGSKGSLTTSKPNMS